MRTFYFLAAIVFIAVVLLQVKPYDYVNSTKATDRDLLSSAADYTASFEEEHEAWSRRIDEMGPGGAYEEFKAEYRTASYGAQHEAAHLFGALLYEKLGVSGIGVCDGAFGFGCYHSFLGVAISREGFGILPLFDQACKEKWGDANLPCQHGIGHGILVSVGEERLLEALDLCATLSWQPTGGCTSGVFMEYNFRTMSDLSGSGVLTRRLGPGEDPHEPCVSLPSKYRPGCYSEQPQWWQRVLRGDHERIGVLCGEVGGALARWACFSGTGNYAAVFSGYDVKETIAICGKMPSSKAGFFCRSGASTGFLAHPEKKHLAREVCFGLGKVEEERCLKGLDANPFRVETQ